MGPNGPQNQLIPQLIVRGGSRAIEFYVKAFGAVLQNRTMTPDGKKLVHSELALNGHKLYVSDEFEAREGGTCKSPPALGGTCVRITLVVADADAVVDRAKAAGATELMPVQDMFWGARYGKIIDPFGHEWGVSQTTQPQTEEETQDAANKFFRKR